MGCAGSNLSIFVKATESEVTQGLWTKLTLDDTNVPLEIIKSIPTTPFGFLLVYILWFLIWTPLIALRLGSWTIVLLLMGQPVCSRQVVTWEKPILAVLLDQSESLADVFDIANAQVVVPPKTLDCNHRGHLGAGEYVIGKGTKIWCSVCDGRWYSNLKEVIGG